MTRLGIAAIALLFIAGIALVAAPFALGTQPPEDAWTTATRDDVIVGAAVTATAFLGFFTTLAGHVADLYTRATRAAIIRSQATRLDDPDAPTAPLTPQ